MDTLGNLFTKIRNAYRVRKESVTAPMSQLNWAVLQVLAREGYIRSSEAVVEPETNRSTILIQLAYANRQPMIEKIQRISKPGRRVYAGIARLPRPRGGFGTMLLSTPVGILTTTEARKHRVGGEVLCEIIRGGA